MGRRPVGLDSPRLRDPHGRSAVEQVARIVGESLTGLIEEVPGHVDACLTGHPEMLLATLLELGASTVAGDHLAALSGAL